MTSPLSHKDLWLKGTLPEHPSIGSSDPGRWPCKWPNWFILPSMRIGRLTIRAHSKERQLWGRLVEDAAATFLGLIREVQLH